MKHGYMGQSARWLGLLELAIFICLALASPARAQISGRSPDGSSVPHVGIYCVNGTGTDVVCPFAGGSGSAPATPVAGDAAAITTGGVAKTLVLGPVNGCYVTNPLAASDQNIGTAEVAYINGVTTATATGSGTNAALQPGQSWACVPGQTTNVSAIAATSGHAFTVVKW